jgi:hypothetical protein
MTAIASDRSPDCIAEPTERSGSWEDAEHWRRESFLWRTPAQRMKWLEMVMLARRGGGIAGMAGR